jgi:hypothetical protein
VNTLVKPGYQTRPKGAWNEHRLYIFFHEQDFLDILSISVGRPGSKDSLGWNHTKALFTSPVFSLPKDMGICGDLVFTQYSQILSNTLPQKYSTMMKSF